MKVLKLGIIGGGVNSAVGKAHFSALALSNLFVVSAACFSRNNECNLETANWIGLSSENVYSDFKELIDKRNHDLDAILILTPTDQHCDQVVYALRNGINVICEKSLTTSLSEAYRISESLKKSHSKLFVIYNYLGYPMVKELKNMIHDGKLGNIHSLKLEMPQEGFIRKVNGKPILPQEWRLKDNEIPTVSLDLGVHLHMLAYYLTGASPIRTASISKTQGNFKGIVDDVNALIEYSGNISCDMWFSKIASGHRNGLTVRIYGTEGNASWIQTEPENIFFSDIEGNRMIIDRNSPNVEISRNETYHRFKGGHPAGFIEALANYYIDIAKAFHNKYDRTDVSSEVFGIEESIEGLKLFKAISDSSKNKCWIEL
jgi:predicted dehydrogenase